MPRMAASTGVLRKRFAMHGAGKKSRLPRRPTAVLPPSRPRLLVFDGPGASRSWPRHPPGGGSCRPPCANPATKWLQDIGMFRQTSRKYFPIIGKPKKNFSNRWKNRAKFSSHWKTFFQSLEKMCGIFQPLEKFFPIIGKLAVARRASGLRARRQLFAGARHFPVAGGAVPMYREWMRSRRTPRGGPNQCNPRKA